MKFRSATADEDVVEVVAVPTGVETILVSSLVEISGQQTSRHHVCCVETIISCQSVQSGWISVLTSGSFLGFAKQIGSVLTV